MQFYRIDGLIQERKKPSETGGLQTARERRTKIALKADELNQKFKKKAFFFVTVLSESTLTAGVICREPLELTDKIEAFLSQLNIDLKEIHRTEVTLSTICNMLQSAGRTGYMENADEDILEQFDFIQLTGRYGRMISYDEEMIEETGRPQVYKVAEKFLARESLIPELDRIYAGKAVSRAKGHPVHYMIQTDDKDTRDGVCNALLRAIYASGRLQNKRFSLVRFKPGEKFSETAYECLYKSSTGGAILVRYIADDDTEEDDYACPGRETIETLCEMMRKYRNQVLTVFCLPRECTKVKDIFYENLGTTSFVEIKEDFAYGERAEGFLKMLARENGVRTDKRLFARLENGRGYLSTELRDLFEEWYNDKLKTTIYPQYRQIAGVRRKIAAAKPKGSAYEEMMEMIGLSAAKKIIMQAIDYHKAQKIFADKGMKIDRPAMHMIFTGNPGTAKTTVARLFARIMKDNGLLSKGTIVEVGRGDLVGKYVGWTAPTIKKKFKEAAGGVLFIDEAYSLVDDRDGSFGDEAINTIVQEMENHREDVAVIFAGYPDKMEGFLQKNPGLRSRIAFHVHFDDYDMNELCDIAELIARKKGLDIDEKAREKLLSIFAEVQGEKDFGNGRYVRNVIEKARMAQASRLLAKGYDEITGRDIATLCADDFRLPEKKKPCERPKIGFIA